MQISFVGRFANFRRRYFRTATDPCHHLNGTLLQIPEKQPIDGNAKMPPDQARRLESERPGALFKGIIGTFVDSEVFGERGLAFEAQLLSEGF